MAYNIYLDNAATTPLRPEARAAMEPFLSGNYANPSSIYRMAQEARAAIDRARDMIAEGLHVQPSEIVFTSGGSESNNAAIKGAVLAAGHPGHVVTTTFEHHAVLHPVEDLIERFGHQATIVPVGRDGVVGVDAIRNALRPETLLVSVMWANNEIGTVQPIAEIASLLKERGIVFHVDAVQAVGRLPVDLCEVPVDLLTFTAHKFGGPKGTGGLVVRNGTRWWPLISGGGQERNRRAGTENVAGIAAMGSAFEASVSNREEEYAHCRSLRDRLLVGLESQVGGFRVNGDLERRLPGNLNVSFEGIHGESLLVALDLQGIMASSGSACASGSTEPSHVLTAIGLSHLEAQGSLRLTIGYQNTEEEIDRAVGVLAGIVSRLRGLAAPIGRG